VDRRIKGNKLAEDKLPVAKKYSRVISAFPFVRAIMLSGSISKNYMDPNSDIDYFIVTEPGRLWLTRALLALFKRVFLLNSRKFFCINYFVDLRSLEIEEKNIYTAYETATLIPVYGKEVCDKFMAHNVWMKNHFPNLNGCPFEFIKESPSILRRMFEKIFSGGFGEWLDNFFMKLAITRWKKKYGNVMRASDFEIAFKSKKNISKSHPQFFQKRILEFLEKKIQFFEDKHRLKFGA
jgi:predicted nucleotidyltransferase